MTFDVKASGPLLSNTELLAVGVSEDAPTAVPAELDEAFGGELSKLLAEDKFKAKAGSTSAVRSLGRVPSKWVLIVGMGKGSVEDIRRAAGAAGTWARGKGLATMTLSLSGGDEHTTAAVDAVLAGNYRYDRNKAEDSRKAPLESVSILGMDGSEASVTAGVAIGEGRNLARDLVNGPPADIYPETLADAAVALAGARMTVEVWGEDRILDEGMGGVMAVGQASDKPPRFVHMVYEPEGEPTAEVCIVGKGVTFDAGGLSLKPSSGMLTMRCDMAGAGAVVGAMSALQALGITARVHGIFAAAENMISGNSYKLGDVLDMYNGKTVEIHNTDAEGRLLLADCLAYASKLEGVTHVIDLATLTGAAVVALGERYTALYANEQAFSDTLKAAADASGEGFWPMPLEPLYDDMLKSDWAQLKNVGGRAAGSITAALFLQNFVDGKTWSHLDIAGPSFLSKPERHLDKGATGAGVPALLAWLRGL